MKGGTPMIAKKSINSSGVRVRDIGSMSFSLFIADHIKELGLYTRVIGTLTFYI
jgi:hypothetical protein